MRVHGCDLPLYVFLGPLADSLSGSTLHPLSGIFVFRIYSDQKPVSDIIPVNKYALKKTKRKTVTLSKKPVLIMIYIMSPIYTYL